MRPIFGKAIATLLFFSILFISVGYGLKNAEAGYAPIQPIAFSHRIHTGENKIPCLYCHVYARKSTIAGVPSVQRCMGCHKIIGSDRPEVRKITEYFEGKKPIPWVRVYRLQDFVYFSHKRHVLKEVACQECHGPIETMDRVERYSSLDMGWCLTCHKKREVDMDCLVCHK